MVSGCSAWVSVAGPGRGAGSLVQLQCPSPCCVRHLGGTAQLGAVLAFYVRLLRRIKGPEGAVPIIGLHLFLCS